ncbi:hypothetical protein AYJ66_04295 [Dietzia cinnamea]|nr:hypothetical protein AYJ66_04295 [Dietzia cinnamea]
MVEWAHSLGIEYVSLPMRRDPDPVRDLISLGRLISIVRQLKPDLVVFGTPKAGLLGMLGSWFCGVRLRVYVVHGLRFQTARGLYRWVLIQLEKLSIRLATTVLCVSESIQSELAANGVAVSRVSVPGYGSIAGVDTDKFDVVSFAERRAARAEVGLSGCERVYLFVGRVQADKGISLLADLAVLIERDDPSSLLVIVGPYEGGRSDAEAYRALEESPNVRLVGRVDDVRPFLWSASVLLLPSGREGLPISLIEAGACGVPVVATPVTGCVDVVDNDVVGELIPASDPEVWLQTARKLATAADHPDRREAIRKYTRRKYDMDRVCETWAAAYRDLIGIPS